MIKWTRGVQHPHNRSPLAERVLPIVFWRGRVGITRSANLEPARARIVPAPQEICKCSRTGQDLEKEEGVHTRELRALIPAPKPLPPQEYKLVKPASKKEQLLFALAKELGFFVQPRARWLTTLATTCAASMRTRQGKHLYQSV